MKLRVCPPAVLALAATTLGQQQQEICHAAQIAPRISPWSETLTVPAFDPGLGTLTRVDVTVSAQYDVLAAVENRDTFAVQVDLVGAATLEFFQPDGALLATLTDSTAIPIPLAPFDGVVDSAGTSGATFPELFPDDITSAAITDTSLLPQFVATAATLDFALDSTVDVVFNGLGGNYETTNQNLCGATLLVCYSYIPPTRTLRFEDSVAPANAGWVESVSVPRFDPRLGTLIRASLRLSGESTNRIAIENLDSSASTISANLSGTLTLERPDGSPLFSVTQAESFLQTLAAHDGDIDFGGLSGHEQVLAAPFDEASDVSPADLQLFVGSPGIRELMSFELEAAAQSMVSLGGSVVTSFTFSTGARFEVEYEYLPAVRELEHERALPTAPQSWSQSLVFPRFDPVNGLLAAMELELEVTQQGSASCESLDVAPSTSTLHWRSLVTLRRPDTTELLTATPEVTMEFTSTAFDGIADFGGSSGMTEPALQATATARRFEFGDSPELALFTSASPGPDSLVLSLDAFEQSFTQTSSTNLIEQFVQASDARVRVRYHYLPNEGAFCFGDGGDQGGCTPCPCDNEAPYGSSGGCLNASGTSAVLVRSGVASEALDTLSFDCFSASPNTFAVLTSGVNRLPQSGPCAGLASGIGGGLIDGLRCVGGSFLRHGTRPTDADGRNLTPWGPPGAPTKGLIAQSGFSAGETRHFQLFYREDAALGCGSGQNTSNGVSVTVEP